MTWAESGGSKSRCHRKIFRSPEDLPVTNDLKRRASHAGHSHSHTLHGLCISGYQDMGLARRYLRKSEYQAACIYCRAPTDRSVNAGLHCVTYNTHNIDTMQTSSHVPIHGCPAMGAEILIFRCPQINASIRYPDMHIDRKV